MLYFLFFYFLFFVSFFPFFFLFFFRTPILSNVIVFIDKSFKINFFRVENLCLTLQAKCTNLQLWLRKLNCWKSDKGLLGERRLGFRMEGVRYGWRHNWRLLLLPAPPHFSSCTPTILNISKVPLTYNLKRALSWTCIVAVHLHHWNINYCWESLQFFGARWRNTERCRSIVWVLEVRLQFFLKAWRLWGFRGYRISGSGNIFRI